MVAPSDSLLEALRNTQILYQTSEENLQKICKMSDIFSYEAGREVLYKDQENINLFIVMSGTFEVSLPSFMSDILKDITIAKLEMGDSFGEFSFIEHKPAIANVEVAERGKLMIVPFYRLEKLIAVDIKFGKQFYLNLLKIAISRARANNIKRKEVTVWDLSFCR